MLLDSLMLIHTPVSSVSMADFDQCHWHKHSLVRLNYPTEGNGFLKEFSGDKVIVLYKSNILGVKSTNRIQQLNDMNEICYEKVSEQVRRGQQVISLCKS